MVVSSLNPDDGPGGRDYGIVAAQKRFFL